MDYILTTDRLCKNYKRFRALDELSMHVPKGAIYGFVGKNGAGKTTLIRLICGLQKPTSGTYTLYGMRQTESEIAKARRRMGAVVESPSIYLDMTAEENLKEQYRILGMPSFDGIQELLELVGIANTGKKKAKNFSLGMRQRLGIGITVLISSHILDELSKLATHYGFIDRGHIIKEVSAKELEEAGRKCIRVEVSDIKALARILDTMKIEYKIISDKQADVYAKVNVSTLALEFAKEQCEIISMQERDESLESYYMNLIGGDKDE